MGLICQFFILSSSPFRPCLRTPPWTCANELGPSSLALGLIGKLGSLPSNPLSPLRQPQTYAAPWSSTAARCSRSLPSVTWRACDRWPGPTRPSCSSPACAQAALIPPRWTLFVSFLGVESSHIFRYISKWDILKSLCSLSQIPSQIGIFHLRDPPPSNQTLL